MWFTLSVVLKSQLVPVDEKTLEPEVVSPSPSIQGRSRVEPEGVEDI